MNLKLIESFVELIELGAFANKEDIVKGLNSAIKVTKKQAELTDEEINKLWAESHEDGIAMQLGFTTQQHYFAHLILRKAQKR